MAGEVRDALLREMGNKLNGAVDLIISVRKKCGSLPMPDDEEELEELREGLRNEICREVKQYEISRLGAVAKTPIVKLAEILNQTDVQLLGNGETLRAADAAAAEGLPVRPITVRNIRIKWLHKGRRKRKVPEARPEPSELGLPQPEFLEPEEASRKQVIEVPEGMKQLTIEIRTPGGLQISFQISFQP